VAVSFIGEETGVLSFITGWLIAFVEPLVILFIYKSQSSESTTCHNLWDQGLYVIEIPHHRSSKQDPRDV
jgi:hypothetical protein